MEAAFWTILVAMVSNTACALVGCFLVLRRMSMLGDAISHSILPGIALAFLLTGSLASLPMFVGAMALGMLTVLFTEGIHRWGGVPEDASMGVVFTSLFSVGVILITVFANNVHIDPGCVLYGMIEFVPLDTIDLWGVAVPRALETLFPVMLITIAFVTLLWKELKVASFDPALATTLGYSAWGVHLLLMGMVAGVTVAAFEAVGSILVIAMLIVPAATAHLLTDRLRTMLLAAVAVSWLAAIGGYYFAVKLNTSVAGMMAVIAGLEFGLAVFFAPKHGLLGKAYRKLALATRIVQEDLLGMLYKQTERADADENQREATGIAFRRCLRFAASRGPAGWLALPELFRRRRVRLERNLLVLTSRGMKRAQSIVRGHRLWERYMEDSFELPLDHLHEPAERIEHFLGPELQNKIAGALAVSDIDPHGRPIPPLAEASEEGTSPQQ